MITVTFIENYISMLYLQFRFIEKISLSFVGVFSDEEFKPVFETGVTSTYS